MGHLILLNFFYVKINRPQMSSNIKQDISNKVFYIKIFLDYNMVIHYSVLNIVNVYVSGLKCQN